MKILEKPENTNFLQTITELKKKNDRLNTLLQNMMVEVTDRGNDIEAATSLIKTLTSQVIELEAELDRKNNELQPLYTLRDIHKEINKDYQRVLAENEAFKIELRANLMEVA
jgi:2-hydroxy-3-keto-5-methylthiopentenyl-1-phosphate phosphatase